MTELIDQKIEVLTKVRHCIVRGENNMLCFAILTVGSRHVHLQSAAELLGCYVRRALGACGTLEVWQRRIGGYITDGESFAARKADRLAWIDWMIADLEKQKVGK